MSQFDPFYYSEEDWIEDFLEKDARKFEEGFCSAVEDFYISVGSSIRVFINLVYEDC